MTNVVVSREKGHVVSVQCKGHSGYAPEGEDIVCAALSAVGPTAGLGGVRVGGGKAHYHTDEDKGSLSLAPGRIGEEKSRPGGAVLGNMLLGGKEFKEGYPAFIKLEVKDDVY